MGGAENVKVCCRVRPLNDIEKKKNEKPTVKCINDQQIQIEGKEKKYNFDAVLGPNSTQKEVYDAAAKAVVDHVLEVKDLSLSISLLSPCVLSQLNIS